jgi:hypothetical protein
MRLQGRSWLVAALVLLALASRVRGQSFGFPWWRDAQFQRDLSLTSDQTTRIENLFQSTVSATREKAGWTSGRRAVASDCGQCRRKRRHETIGQGGSDALEPEQDAHAAIAPHPPGPLAGAADEAEPDSRSVGKGTPSASLEGRPAEPVAGRRPKKIDRRITSSGEQA